MNRRDFFQIDASQIDRNELLTSLASDNIDVLKNKYNWLSKIIEDENKRQEGLRNKAGLLLGFHIGFMSLLLNSTFFNLFSKLEEIELGLGFTAVVIVFIFVSIIFGIYFSLKVGIIPSFRNVIDPTLSLEFYESEEKWLTEAITEMLIVYKKNLDRIALDVHCVRLSFRYFLISVFSSISIFVVFNIYNLIIG
jgi:hypothetical protein